jgi:hypothetical protein
LRSSGQTPQHCNPPYSYILVLLTVVGFVSFDWLCGENAVKKALPSAEFFISDERPEKAAESGRSVPGLCSLASGGFRPKGVIHLAAIRLSIFGRISLKYGQFFIVRGIRSGCNMS